MDPSTIRQAAALAKTNPKAAYEWLTKTAKKRVRFDIKTRGWKGSQKIPVASIRAFVKDILTIPGAGFNIHTLTVQIDENELPKLDLILKKHGLVEATRMPAKRLWGPTDTKGQALLKVQKKPKVFVNVVLRQSHGKILPAPRLKRLIADVKKAIPEAVWDPKLRGSGGFVIPEKEQKKLTPILDKHMVGIQVVDFARQERTATGDDLATIKQAAALAQTDPNAAYDLLES